MAQIKTAEATDTVSEAPIQAQTRFGVVLVRGRRYRAYGVVHMRNQPKVVDREQRDYLVEETGFFRDIALDANGRPMQPKARRSRRRRGRSRIIGGESDLMDTGQKFVTQDGDDEAPDSEGAIGV